MSSKETSGLTSRQVFGKHVIPWCQALQYELQCKLYSIIQNWTWILILLPTAGGFIFLPFVLLIRKSKILKYLGGIAEVFEVYEGIL